MSNITKQNVFPKQVYIVCIIYFHTEFVNHGKSLKKTQIGDHVFCLENTKSYVILISSKTIISNLRLGIQT